MLSRRLFNLMLTLVLVLGMVSSLGLAPQTAQAATPAQAAADKIEAELLAKFAAEGSADFIVRFANQADLSPAYNMSWEARGEFVVQALTEAAKVQANAIAYVEGRGLKHETFIAGNDLYVFLGVETDALALAELAEVDSVRLPRTQYIEPATPVLQSFDVVVADPQPDTLAWGIADAKGDQFWAQFGVQGDGIKVANIDTGVEYTHSALDQAFACPGDPGNAACWSDPENWCGGTACDNNGHGTHTMGTMVADDDPGLTWQAGMAPNATWIACKGCGTSSCSDFALNSCADWILQPGGNTANRPNVVNNSWGGGGGSGWYTAKINAWVAAGIFPAFSAGNSTGCGSMGSPGDYQESFATTGHDSSRNHAWAQGPSAFGHTPYTKPNITGPSINVCSSVPGNAWNCSYGGTSMASPHSAGTVALLMSCNPGLIGQVDTLFQALQDGADAPFPANPACGVPPDNEGTYEDGYGYLNALQSGILYCGSVDTGFIDGYVYEADGTTPIEGASVVADPVGEAAGIDAITDPTGYFTMTVLAGNYDVTASKNGYTAQTINGVVVLSGQVTSLEFSLNFLGQWMPGPNISACFDLTRIDAKFFPATGKIYILGGRGGADGSVTVGDIFEFDPVTGVCADTGANMPTPISNYTANLVNDGTSDVLCTFGGRNSAGGTTLDVQCYDPVANTASIVATLPTAWTGYTPGAQVVVDNMVYIFGGFNSLSAPYMTDRTEKYDPVTHGFTQLGNLSLARSYILATAVDGIIYAFGGDTFDGASLYAQTIAEKMDPAVGTWDDAGLADLPIAGDEGRAFGFDTGTPYGFENQIVLATMAQWSGDSAEVILYDIASDSYDTTFPDLITARRNHGGTFVPLSTDDPNDGLPGMWVLGGRAGADTPPYAPVEYYPLAVGTLLPPDISVSVTSLYAEQVPDTTTLQTFQICNIGEEPLDWTLIETQAVFGNSMPFVPVNVEGTGKTAPITTGSPAGTAGKVAPAANPEDVLWDQPLGTNIAAYVNQEFSDFPTYSTWQADDFVNTENWYISSIYVPGDGWNGFSSLLNATGLTWQIYEDCAGVPCGDPAGGGEPPVWTLTLAPSDAHVTLTTGTSGFLSNALLTLDTPVTVPPGTWWFVYYPTLNFGTGGQYGRQPANTTNGYRVQIINPGGAFGIGTVWTDWSAIGVVESDNAFRLEGTAQPPFDAPWLSEDPVAGTVAGGACVDVNVTFDSTGLAIGDYFAGLQIDSNDPDTPQINIPVQLKVVEPCDPPVADFTFMPLEPIVGETVTFTGTATGTEPLAFAWTFGDGMTATGAVVNHAFAAAGTYTVTLTVTNECGTDVVEVAVVVAEPPCNLPVADFEWLPLDPVVAETVTFTGTATGDEPLAFAWDFGDGMTATGAVVDHAFEAAGDYTVTLTVENACGVDVVEYLVTVTEPPCEPVDGVDFTWEPVDFFAGDEVTFTGSATGTEPFEFAWLVSDGLTATEDITGTGEIFTYLFETAGAYTVTLTVTNECGMDDVTYSFDVAEPPAPVYMAYLPIILRGYTQP